MNKLINRQLWKEKGQWDKPFPQFLIMWSFLIFRMTVKQVIFPFQRRACPDKAASKTSLLAAFKIANLINDDKTLLQGYSIEHAEARSQHNSKETN